MSEERWLELVERLEHRSQSDPRGYRRRVGLLAALGYAYLGLTLAAVAGLSAAVVYFAVTGPALLLKLLIPLGALALVVLRALWIRVEPPEGIPVRRADAPELFALVDDLRGKVDGPKVHRVLLEGELNASIVQVPRLGVLGPQRNYLVLGLPLLQALPPDEFSAVVAHELGHLSRSHGRFSAWIYRVRRTWSQLLDTLEEKRSWGTFVFRRFFEWYAPYFNAYSFVLARAHEYEADAASARAAGNRASGLALANLSVAGRYLDESYWPGLYERASREPRPPESAFVPMAHTLRGAGEDAEILRWLDDALAYEGDPTDTHPPLSRRLAALGLGAAEVTADVAARRNGSAPALSAAQRYLGALEGTVAEQLDREWRASVSPAWQQRYVEAERAQRRLAELDGLAEPSLEELVERAALVEEYRGGEEALARYRDVLECEPEHGLARFAVGRLLLTRGSDEGLDQLERAMASEPEAVLPACEVAYEYLVGQGRREEAERYGVRAEVRMRQIEQAVEERSELDLETGLEPHELPAEVVSSLEGRLAQHDGVARAYLARKRVRHLDDEDPLYVVAVVPSQRWRTLWREAGEEEPSLAERLVEALDLPVSFSVVVPHPRSDLERRLEQIPGSRIYTS
ncbi:MAG: M48 family metalloprotease [Actinobacteria bacterium]|nr:M48 family metalloprotease [Actinomycetota bacterium]